MPRIIFILLDVVGKSKYHDRFVGEVLFPFFFSNISFKI